MTSKFNDALELIESLSLEEQEQLIEIEQKRLIERKREILLDDIRQSKKEISEGNSIKGNPADILKAIEDETKNLK
ncbi:MAG: hypothetical protein IT281_02395 [Ignavibacteria bacterium]|nr:hypothetical protein [Ignavibacteria bacterium]MCC7158369.1 hypothetical protein [Ignavibacteria bacterium]